MSETKHTPGRWHVTQRPDLGQILICCDGSERMSMEMGGTTVAPISVIYGETAENEANARLIAAAPELLRACQLAIGQLEGSKPRSGFHAASLKADIEIVKSAIAKAKG